MMNNALNGRGAAGEGGQARCIPPSLGAPLGWRSGRFGKAGVGAALATRPICRANEFCRFSALPPQTRHCAAASRLRGQVGNLKSCEADISAGSGRVISRGLAGEGGSNYVGA